MDEDLRESMRDLSVGMELGAGLIFLGGTVAGFAFNMAAPMWLIFLWGIVAMVNAAVVSSNDYFKVLAWFGVLVVIPLAWMMSWRGYLSWSLMQRLTLQWMIGVIMLLQVYQQVEVESDG